MAHLINMEGSIIHSWQAELNEDDSWHHIEICKNGDLLVIVKDKYLMRLDWDSKIKWIKKMRSHHDIQVAENNDIYTLSRKEEVKFP